MANLGVESEPKPDAAMEQQEEEISAFDLPDDPPVEEPPLPERIMNMLNMFGLTRQQIQDGGIEPTMLEYLPEDEVVLQLTEIVGNLP